MLLLFMDLLDAPCAHNRLPLSVVVILRGDMAQLVALGKHGVRQRIQWQCPCTVSLRDGRRELDGTRHTVYRGDERAALQYRVYDTGIERFVGITAVLVFRMHVGGRHGTPQRLVSSLVQQVRAAQTDKEHLQQRVTHEQTGHNTRYRQQVVPKAQRLRLAGKSSQQDVGQHGHDISEVARDIAQSL